MIKRILTVVCVAYSVSANAIWHSEKTIDEIDDSINLHVYSDNGTVSTDCYSLRFNLDSPVRSEILPKYKLTVRVDKNKPIELVGTSKKDSISVTHEQVVGSGLLDQLINGNKLIFRADDFYGDEITKSVFLSGFKVAMEDIMCDVHMDLHYKDSVRLAEEREEKARLEREQEKIAAEMAEEERKQADKLARDEADSVYEDFKSQYIKLIQRRLIYSSCECKVSLRLSKQGFALGYKKLSGDRQMCDAVSSAITATGTFPMPDNKYAAEKLRNVELSIITN